MTTCRLLVIDADVDFATALCRYLARFGLQAQAVHDLAALDARLQDPPPDIVLLDPALPDADGAALALHLARALALPLVLMPAAPGPWERVMALEAGAEDVLGKPFEPRELVARLQVLHRRLRPRAATGAPAWTCEGWTLEREARRVTAPGGRQALLSDAECRMLVRLWGAARQVVTREDLAALTRGGDAGLGGRAVDLQVSRLRRKLAALDGAGDPIRTVRGRGYRFAPGRSPAGSRQSGQSSRPSSSGQSGQRVSRSA